MQIEAAVARKEFAPLSFETLDLEAPRHDEVQVRLVASGVCHTDMAIRDQAIVPMPQPIVLGHEGAGVVEKSGGKRHQSEGGGPGHPQWRFLRKLPQLPGQPAVLLL
jgi:aryl-alcohol dehydrogenase